MKINLSYIEEIDKIKTPLYFAYNGTIRDCVEIRYQLCSILDPNRFYTEMGEITKFDFFYED